MSYSQKLKDPRWQKKRLEVMEAANFTCQTCGSTTNTLTVHHINYRRGAEPWDYEASELQCLCDDCHTSIEHLVIPSLREMASRFNPGVMMRILSALPDSAPDWLSDKSEQLAATVILDRAAAKMKAERILDLLQESKALADVGTGRIIDLSEEISFLI